MNPFSQQLLEVKLLLELRKYGELDEGKLKKLALGALAAGAVGAGAHQLAKSDEPVKTERPGHVRTVEKPDKPAFPTRAAPRQTRTSAAGRSASSGRRGKSAEKMHPAASPETATGHSRAALRVKEKDPTFLTKTDKEIHADKLQHQSNRAAGWKHLNKNTKRIEAQIDRAKVLRKNLRDSPEDKSGDVLNKGGMRGAIIRGERPEWGPPKRHPDRTKARSELAAHQREVQRSDRENETEWKRVLSAHKKSSAEQQERKHSHGLMSRIRTWAQKHKK